MSKRIKHSKEGATPGEVTRWRKRNGFDLRSGWPPSTEQFALAHRHISAMEQEYRRDPKPMFVARAYLQARSLRLPIPDFVIAYLDSAFRNLLEHSGRLENKRSKRGEIAAAIRDAFGFIPGGVDAATRKLDYPNHPKNRDIGRYHALREHDARELMIWSEIHINELASIDDPIGTAARKFKIHRRTAKRIADRLDKK